MHSLKQTSQSLAELEDGIHHIALSFAVGVLVGFSPFLGLHTVIAVFLCFLTRLNKPALMIGNFLNVPWVIPPYYAFATWLGTIILKMPGITFPTPSGLREILSMEFLNWVISQRILLIPAFVGSAVMSLVLAVSAYFIALASLARIKSTRIKFQKLKHPEIPNM